MIKPLFSLLALMMITSPLAGSAQTAATSTDEKPGYRLGQPFSSEVRREYQEKRDELLEQYRAQQAEQKGDWQNERVQLYVEKMTSRLNAALDRSRLFVGRIETLVARWKAEGKTVAEVETTLTEAKNLIADSQTKIDNLAPAWASLLASTTATSTTSTSTPSVLAAAKDLLREAVLTVKAAHAKVVEAVQELKVINSANN